MKTSALWIIVVAILILMGGFWLARRSNSVGPVATSTDTMAYPTPAATSTPDMSDLVRLSAPPAGSTVKSPLSLAGEARGNWYFEASFPVKVTDATGKVLGQAPAQAQGEWMTTRFVPFKATVSFATSTTATGFIVLEKDNPSGLPEHDASVRIPVRFQ